MSEELERRVAALEARNAVAETIYAYARAIRRGDPADAADQFHEDGVFEIRQGRPGNPASVVRASLQGRAGVLAYLSAGDASAAQLSPVIHNLIVRIDGDTAFASSVLCAHQVGGSRITLAEYEDELRLADGRWRLQLRVCTLFG